jgi:hypothetical protein
METMIDDFTTGPLTVEIRDTGEPNRGVQEGNMLGGSRRTVVTLDMRESHHHPLNLDLGRPDPAGLHLTVPVEAPATLGLFYGEAGGVRVDWSQAEALLFDVAAHTSFLPVTYTIVVHSVDGKRSAWNASFTAPPKEHVLRLAFKDLRPLTSQGVDLQSVRQIDVSLALNGGARIRSFKVV